MDRNVLNDIVNILCANIEKVHGVIITNSGVITNAYGIIEKGKADNSIQSCFISECGIEIIFHNNDLVAKSLDLSHI